jgi:starvation-inducible DNA-binding protein
VTQTSTTPSNRAGLRQDLQTILGEFFELHVQGVEAHAHFVGTRFTGFQRQLEAVVRMAREASNAVAEVLTDIDGDSTRGLVITEGPHTIPGLRPGERCTTAAVTMITHRISLVLNTIRCVCSERGDADPSTAALLGAMADAVHDQALMLAKESHNINSAACLGIPPSNTKPFDPPVDVGSER